MFFIATETSSCGTPRMRIYEAESMEALADYYALEAGDLTVFFKEITEAEAIAQVECEVHTV